MNKTSIALSLLTILIASSGWALDLWEGSGGGARFNLAPTDEMYEPRDDRMVVIDSTGAEYVGSRTGGFYCRPSPADDWRSLNPGSALPNAPWAAGVVNDRAILFVLTPGNNGLQATIWNVRCDELWADAPGVRVGPEVNVPIEASTANPTQAANVYQHVFEIDGNACLGARTTIWCYDMADPARGLFIHQEIADVPPQIPGIADTEAALDSFFVNINPDGIDLGKAWTVQTYRGLPDGRVAMVLTLQYNPQAMKAPSQRWVIVRNTDGTFEAVFESSPVLPIGFEQLPSPIGQASEIHYDAEWDALWVGPVMAWQPSGLTHNRDEIGFSGFGYRVIPLNGEGSGFLDLTEAWGETNVCEMVGGICRVPSNTHSRDHAGKLRFYISVAGGNYPWELELPDRDAVDLDGDGLSRAEEAMVGTSDFDADSDDDGALDGTEVVLGTDPKSGSVASQIPVSLIPSVLFASRFGVGTDLKAESQYTTDVLGQVDAPGRLSMRGPLCYLLDREVNGQCIDASGEVVARWTQDYLRTPQVSHDGKLLVISKQLSFDVLDFETGEQREWVGLDKLGPFYNDRIDGVYFTNQLHFYAVDADNLWVTNIVDPADSITPPTVRVTHVDGAGTVRVIFDIQLEACANDVYTFGCDWGFMTATTPRMVLGRGRQQLDNKGQFAIGYHEGSGRMLFALSGSPESYLLGLAVDEDPVVFLRSRGLRNLERDSYALATDSDWSWLFPNFLIGRPGGGYVTEVGVRGPSFERVPTNPLAPRIHKLSALDLFGVWGHTVLDTGGVEWVPSERRINPGDTLWLAAGTQSGDPNIEGYVLFGIGPRGGANPLWPGPHAELEGVTGIGYAADGRLCIADRVGQRLIELKPSDDGTMVPTVETRRAEDVDVIDCFYDGDELIALLGDSSIATMTANGLGVGRPISGSGEPAAFITTADGGYEVFFLDPASDVRGEVYDADGAVAVFRNGETTDDAGPISLNEGSIVHAVLRPDGNMITAFSSVRVQPFGADQLRLQQPPMFVRDGQGIPAVMLGVTNPHQALAQVPGGSSEDPWAAASESSNNGTNNGTTGTHGTNGTNGGDGGSGEEKGCCSTSRSQPMPLALPLVLVFGALRRRQRRRVYQLDIPPRSLT